MVDDAHDGSETVLLVEDDFDLRDALVPILEYEGHQVVSAANGKEALDRLQSAGLKGDVQGGGLFGVLDESSWKVVDQDPSPGARLSQGDTVRLDIDRA